MDKTTRWVIVVIVTSIIVGLAYISISKTSSPTTTPQTASDNGGSPPPAPSSQTTPGSYIAYSAESVKNATGNKILFFHASWCPQCHMLDESIKATTLPDNLTIFKVDYDSNQTLRQQYGVTLQTTLVKIDSNGNKIKSYVAYEEPTFAAVKRELLP